MLVQPLARCPGLAPETAQRLALVALCVGLGLCAMAQGGVRALPPPIVWSGGAMVAVLGWQLWPQIHSGDYFGAFIETAAGADGLLIVVAVLMGFWGLLHVPVGEFRGLRYLGVLFLLSNVAVVMMQAMDRWPFRTHPSLNGLLGVDRCLGAYAVLWMPVMWAWRRWLIILPLALVLATAKFIPITVAGVVLALLMTRAWWMRAIWMMSVPAVTLWMLWNYTIPQRITQRLLTWGHTLHATADHPFAGHGFWPMSQRAIDAYGYHLPSIHSDWLALAFGAGWMVTGLVAFALWRLLRHLPSRGWGSALRLSLVGASLLACAQQVVSHARLASLVLVFCVWGILEQQEHQAHA